MKAKSIKSSCYLFFCCIFLFSIHAYAQELKMNIPVHDPVMIKQDSIYYIYCTGNGIAVWSSADKQHWKAEPAVFSSAPQWAVTAVPGFKNIIWAPDISWHDERYYLYYSISTFGKNNSCIGVATNTTLNTNDPAYSWVDHGQVIGSVPGKTNWNAIDPNLIADRDGTPYLTFGSFWEGLKMVRLTRDRLHIDQPVNTMETIASRQTRENAIEAPFVFRKGEYFYLFASIDYCCKGEQSTYKIIVGRSKELPGPYVDSKGVAMKSGGGDIVLEGDQNWYGAGHNAVVNFDGQDYLIFHGYSAADKGRAKLRIENLNWKNGWPVIQ
ncbi:family 43 glycosylhydrolase [Pedobacter metabolipauper]|uniref:Arabinan endo-1,5-alpha-L-arabinosidase n=1 Tax=Pedobacter metabolipauper TaxID=425513 RepID=A0A4R6SV50_9SPHI|nr:family 43 glycosylhydrolase [Pedobacter metabolipauper]TDQ08913.1 arabinan endo-1,5-alpha-L-arabinosidase [Pedobacter metabolipauper]